ncbi:MAG: DAK2 domain-containing protein [Clostridiales bacterium]|nr:DAK2 domain-containing protein [Clostridiales bacterium]
MKRSVFNGDLLRDMFLMGAALLEHNKASIDAMNVFPVPDGDTGTNMSMTMQRAVAEIRSCDSDTAEAIAAAASLGALKGARGNSGVILSQIFRGISQSLKGKGDVISARMLADAMTSGTEAAYKAVMRPKEGTMLTVSRVMAEYAQKAATVRGAEAYDVLEAMLEGGEDALKKTPDLLPVLKEAGVLDSGGTGLLTIFRGFMLAANGEDAESMDLDLALPGETPEESEYNSNESIIASTDVNDIKFGYCSEMFIIHLHDDVTEADVDRFRDKLCRLGDSVVVVYDTDIIKVHVHSNAPGKVIQFALMLGEIDKLKVDNMREQNRQIKEKQKREQKEQAVVAVSAGEGLEEDLKALGVSFVISGGQTMNPSIDVIAQAIKKVNAKTVFVLPDNSNIILAAQQAANVVDCEVIVLPTKTVMQGISAMTGFNPDASVEENREAMTECFGNVVSGSVTYAVRDTSYNGNTIHTGDIIGLVDNNIVEVCKDVAECSRALIKRIMEAKEDCGFVSVYWGEGADEESAEALVAELTDEYPDVEFMVRKGGQPLYYYYISAE